MPGVMEGDTDPLNRGDRHTPIWALAVCHCAIAAAARDAIITNLKVRRKVVAIVDEQATDGEYSSSVL